MDVTPPAAASPGRDDAPLPAGGQGLAVPPLSLYVHFPWCVRKCPYCDFNSYTRGEDALPRELYLAALERDIASQAPEVAGREVISVFMGGGTPSLFDPDAIGQVLTMAGRHLRLSGDAEITLEANPGAVERGAFREYRAAGVNRVSLGAQSFDAARLSALGRIHSPGDTRRAAEELHAAELPFNLDLMYALPQQEVSGALADLEEALALDPAHLSHYQLTIEAGTVFAGLPPPLPDEEAALAMLEACLARLRQAGFTRYEVSAYARAGRQCRHNLNYWRFGDYLGVGAGAHGKLTQAAAGRIVRTQQTREPRRYMAQAPAALSRAEVPAEQLPFEFMLNALRLPDGFEVELFHTRTGLPWARVARTIGQLQQQGLLGHEPSRCFPTPQGLLFLNDVLLHFLPENRP
jgi:putative oxygen-independent coproporphyrinogen III oxidase